MNAVLNVDRVFLRYPGAKQFAVENVSLDVCAGEAVGIVGESGSGKTTLGRMLVGALPPTEGTVTVDGAPWSAVRRRDPIRQKVQMIFQDPYGALNPWRTPLAAVAEVVATWHHLPSRDAAKRATELLAEVGLSTDAIHRLPRKLSGGQCQRVGIARALATEPTVLVADEPTSSLDVSVQAQILNLLDDLRKRRQLALVLISHDLAVVRYATDRAIVMYGGIIVEQGPTAALLDDPRHPYTRILVDSIPGREGPADTQQNDVENSHGCRFAHRCPLVFDDCLPERPKLIDRGGRFFACIHEDASKAFDSTDHELDSRTEVYR